MVAVRISIQDKWGRIMGVKYKVQSNNNVASFFISYDQWLTREFLGEFLGAYRLPCISVKMVNGER